MLFHEARRPVSGSDNRSRASDLSPGRCIDASAGRELLRVGVREVRIDGGVERQRAQRRQPMIVWQGNRGRDSNSDTSCPSSGWEATARRHPVQHGGIDIVQALDENEEPFQSHGVCVVWQVQPLRCVRRSAVQWPGPEVLVGVVHHHAALDDSGPVETDAG